MVGVSRRWVLAGVGCSVGGLSGCGDYPRHRVLGFTRIEAVSSSGDQVVYRVQPSFSASGGGTEWRTFHDVELVVFGSGGSRVGSYGFGDFYANDESVLEPVMVEASSRAVLMTYKAKEGPCDADTKIEIARSRSDGSWEVQGQRECGEGLPPEPLTETEES